MARGKRWTEEETEVLMKMVAQGLNLQQVYDSGRFPGRTYNAIKKQMWMVCPSFEKEPKTMVSAVHPAKQVLSMEKAIKLFSTAFRQICNLAEVDKLRLERFRIIFQAAKDYGPLLANFEKWEKIEKKIEDLRVAVGELQAAKGAKNP